LVDFSLGKPLFDRSRILPVLGIHFFMMGKYKILKAKIEASPFGILISSAKTNFQRAMEDSSQP